MKNDSSTALILNPGKKTQVTTDLLSLSFLLAALFFMPIGSESASRNALAVVFVSIVLEAIPFMFVGSLVGGLIEVFVSRDKILALMPEKGRLTVFIAAAAGLVFPVCECAVVPVVRRLVGKGLPLSAAVAYLLAGPIVNPIVAASTAMAYAFDWKIVALRLSIGYGIAVIVGLLMGRLFKGMNAFAEDKMPKAETECGCGVAHGHDSHHHTMFTGPPIGHHHDSAISFETDSYSYTSATRLGRVTAKVGTAFKHAADDFCAVGHYLIIGAFIAALAQTYIGRSNFVEMAEIPFASVALMMVLAILLNLCSEADAFIAASFQGLVSIPSQLTFMLTGPMFDIKLLLMYQSLFRRRTIVILAVIILSAVLIAGISLETVYGGWS